MNKLEQLYEGKAKKVFATEDPELVIVDYKDDATAFNGEKKGTIMEMCIRDSGRSGGTKPGWRSGCARALSLRIRCSASRWRKNPISRWSNPKRFRSSLWMWKRRFCR